jgi:hypothetical protein
MHYDIDDISHAVLATHKECCYFQTLVDSDSDSFGAIIHFQITSHPLMTAKITNKKILCCEGLHPDPENQ